MTAMQPIMFASAYRMLTPAEKAFVDDYVASVERAADKVGEPISLALYRPIPPALIEAAGGLLERPMVLAAISERITQIAADTELTDRRIVKELTNIAFSNMNDYMEICPMTGRPSYDLSRCTPEQMAAVKAVKHEVTSLGAERLEFVTHDKLKALDMLARIRGLLTEDNAYMQSERKSKRDAQHLIDKSANAADAYAAFIGE